MSGFERQCLGALELAGKIIGEATFTLTGVSGKCHGVFSELSKERDLDDGGGRKTSYTGTLVCPASQFTGKKPDLGARLTLAGRTYRLVKVDEDSISFTLWMGNVNL